MNHMTRGMAAGLVATIVLSILMVLKTMAGMMPALSVPAMLGTMTQTGVVGGWAIHFIIGTIIWGIAFAMLYDRIPGEQAWLKGVLFGIGAWILMMIIAMPMAGAGFFGMNMGIMAPVATLVLHIIYGAVLGWVYGMLSERAATSPV